MDEELTTAALRLRELTNRTDITSNDPRLGAIVRELSSGAKSALELAEEIIGRSHDPEEVEVQTTKIGKLRSLIDRLKRLDLRAELAGLLEEDLPARDIQITLEQQGWGGLGRKTLQEVGDRHGLTRERVRQIVARSISRFHESKPFTPVLDEYWR
ncbi:MAG: sigma factor-like helix-turn-helix DNA-binding protein [Dehalococcoidia bacterium]